MKYKAAWLVHFSQGLKSECGWGGGVSRMDVKGINKEGDSAKQYKTSATN